MTESDPDERDNYDEEYIKRVREFLLRHGAVEYLSYLSQEPRRFIDMQNELALGDGTLHELHARAEGLDLRTIDHQKRDGKAYRVHRLTPRGKITVKRMRELGVTQRHTRLRTVRKEYEQAKQDYLEWVEDKDAFITEIEGHIDRIDPRKGPGSTAVRLPEIEDDSEVVDDDGNADADNS